MVERITYQNAETGFTVARFNADEELVTIVGNLPTLHPGEGLKITGRWTVHPTYGRQFTVDQSELQPPVTVGGVERYLGSGLIKGIGPVTAGRIVSTFGVDALEIIEKTPERLREVEGIGPQKAERITRALEEQKEIRQVMVFLRGIGITPALAAKIYRQYGENTIGVLRDNPYHLAKEVYGIGFKTADRIAGLLGQDDPTSPKRVRAGILYLLHKNSEEGHVYALEDTFIKVASEELEVEPEIIHREIQRLRQEKEVFLEENCLYLAALYWSEYGVVERLLSLLQASKSESLPPEARDQKGLQEKLSGLALGQRQAVELALEEGVLIITGGPGTGKTTTIRSIIQEFQDRNLSVALAAPTGRAAKRLSEATGVEAKTIHRLLEFGFTPGTGLSYGRNEEKPLEVEAVIIDEASMIDLFLFHHLLKAISPGTKLVLVGDEDQLPSVGPGSVLKDLISSGVAPVVILKTIFRQARESQIVTNAHRINAGLMPILSQKKDFFFIEAKEPETVVDELLRLVMVRLPSYLKCDPMREIQVLSPMRRTITGVENLNHLLQRTLNPASSAKPQVQFGGRTFRLGDKVMQIRNDYQKMVFNGDMGRIIRLDPEERQLEVEFNDEVEERRVLYEEDELDELTLSYAVTVHKSQGSEYPVVVMPLTTQHYLMLQRNLFYTAVTRAKKMVVLVGQKKAIAMAAKNDQIERRNSRLGEILSQAVKSGELKIR